MAAQAADGCKFLLCVAAPNPMGIPECVPTIKEVVRDLRKGRGLPTCQLENGQSSQSTGNFVTYRRAPLTPSCPEGTHQGRLGVFYHQGPRPNIPKNSVYSGIPSISGGVTSERHITYIGRSEREHWTGEYSRRVCVGGQDYGQLVTGGRSYLRGEYSPTRIHHFFEKVVVMTPDGADYEFDVTIDGKHHSRHRFSF